MSQQKDPIVSTAQNPTEINPCPKCGNLFVTAQFEEGQLKALLCRKCRFMASASIWNALFEDNRES